LRNPWRLHFTNAARDVPFLRLDDAADRPLAGWEEFFLGLTRPLDRPVDPRLLDRLIAELDHNRFEVREQAAEALHKLGSPARCALEKLLAGRPPLEVRERAERVLTKIGPADQPLGFYDVYPLRSVKAGATVLAISGDDTIRLPDGGMVPYLVTQPFGKGRVVYLGSAEMWRLRMYREAYHENFWRGLVRHAGKTEG
jgi:hypothetical protein